MSWLWALLLLAALLSASQVLAAPADGGVSKREADPHHRRKFKLRVTPHKLTYKEWGRGVGGQSEAHAFSHSFAGPFGSFASSGSFSSAWAGHG